MRHIAVAQAVRRQQLVEPRLGADVREALIDVGGRDPGAALGQKHRGVLQAAKARPHLGQILLHDLDRPVKDRQHRAALRTAAALFDFP